MPAPDTEFEGTRLRVSILGAGAVAYGAAAFLARAGHDPLLWSPSGKRTAALAAGEPLVARNAIEGTFAVRVASSCADAVADADAILLALARQRPQARARRGGAAPARRPAGHHQLARVVRRALPVEAARRARGARADRRLGNDADDRTPGEPDRGQRRDGAPARRHGDRSGERRRRRLRALQRSLRRPLREARWPPGDRPQQPQPAEPSRHRPAQPDAHGARRDLGSGRERHPGRRPPDRGPRPRAPRHRRGVRPAREDRAGAFLAVVPRHARERLGDEPGDARPGPRRLRAEDGREPLRPRGRAVRPRADGGARPPRRPAGDPARGRAGDLLGRLRPRLHPGQRPAARARPRRAVGGRAAAARARRLRRHHP